MQLWKGIFSDDACLLQFLYGKTIKGDSAMTKRKAAEMLYDALSEIMGLDFGPFCAEEAWPDAWKEGEAAMRAYEKSQLKKPNA